MTQQNDYLLFAAPRPYSFELNEDMVAMLREEFDVPALVEKFAQAASGKAGKEIEATAKEIFGSWGRAWMARTLQLGEEYPDRTYEVLKEAADRTGVLTFPHVPQRFIEIGYLATHQIYTLPVVENNSQRLIYKLANCYVYRTLQEKIGHDAATALPCRYMCAAVETLGEGLGLDLVLDHEATTNKDGYCQFRLRRA